MLCPFRKEVTMVYCEAWPVKKPVPADQLVPAGPCSCDFEHCPLFEEAMARLRRASQPVSTAGATGHRKEVP